MTANTPPSVKIEWEPITEGIKLYLGHFQELRLPMMSVRELMYDMEEAMMLSRGYVKVADYPVAGVEDTWIVRIMGNDFRVASTFLESRSKFEGAWICLQDAEGREVVWPAEDLVTAYRPVE